MVLFATTRSNGAMLVAILSMTFLASAQQTAQQILSESGISAGLCIHVGCGDGNLTKDLHNGGSILVQGLSSSEDEMARARTAIRKAGLYGIISISCPPTLTELPYRDNMVNLVVADLDNLGASGPSESEISRILIPSGVAYVKKGGTWRRTVKPRPATLDTWTHLFHGPDGNACSNDMAVNVATGLQWTAGFGMQIPGRGTAFSAEKIIINEKQFFASLIDPDSRTPIKADFDSRPFKVVARDAFNGIALWRISSVSQNKHTAFACDDKRLLLPTGKGKYLASFDVQTGKVAVTYTSGSPLVAPAGANDVDNGYQGIMIDGKVVQAQNEKISVLDAASGNLVWEWNAGSAVAFPRSTPGSGKLWVAIGKKGWNYWWREDPGSAESARFPSMMVQEVACFNLADGKLLWRGGDLGGMGFNNMMLSGDRIVFWDSGKTDPNGPDPTDPEGPKAYCVDANSGREYWHIVTTTAKAGQLMLPGIKTWGGRSGLVIDKLFANDGFTFHNLSDGQMTIKAETPGKTQGLNGRRCQSSSATKQISLCKGLLYVKPSTGEWIVNEITRPSCAYFPYPANGFIYYNPQACGCSQAFMRTYVTTTSEAIPAPLGDSKRLIRGTAGVDQPASEIMSPLATLPASSVVFDWSRNWDYAKPLKSATIQVMPEKIGPIDAGAVTLTVVVHEHRVEARQGSALKWVFTAGSRISTVPAVSSGNAYIASHDGYVYCVRLTDGSMKWKFLAAARDRRMCVSSQVESVWPVFGAVVESGKVYFSAGRHPDADGGVHVYRVDGESGEMEFHAVVRAERKWRKAIAGYSAPVQQFTNTAPSVADGIVTITSFTCNTRTGAMTLNGVAYTRVPELVGVVLKGPGAEHKAATGRITAIPIGSGTVFSVQTRVAAQFDVVDARGRCVIVRRIGSAEVWQSPPVLLPGLYLARLRGADGMAMCKTVLVGR